MLIFVVIIEISS